MGLILNHELADKVMTTVEDTLAYLYSRWQDEKGYENIEDYKLPIVKALEEIKDVEVLSMIQKPFFGFKWKGSDGGLRRTVISRRKMRTDRIG